MSRRPHFRASFAWLALAAAAGLLCPSARSDDDKKKEKKVEPWVEIRTQHFEVASDGGEKTARRIEEEFDKIRRLIQLTMPGARVDMGFPIRILAGHDGKSFAIFLPEFPEDKRRTQPLGMFVPGSEISYIALRANVGGQAPYTDIYEEYARLILKQSYHSLPPWLEEGFANIYGSITINDKGAGIGRPGPDDMSTLYASPLLPLDLVLHQDRSSAYYTQGDKKTVYFAESHALVHYLVSDPMISEKKSLERYITLVEGGADSFQAAKEAFGDLDQLQQGLEAYIKQITSGPPSVQNIGAGEAVTSVRTLSPAETDALIGDFAMTRGKPDSARSKLEDAIELDHSLASPEQSLGYLSLEKRQLDEAEKHFERAVALDPQSALAYYGRGLVAMDKANDAPAGNTNSAIVAFEKTVSLNADFAPAWADLASLYALGHDTLQKALDAERHAISLTPGDSSYQFEMATILADMGRVAEARKLAEQLQNTAHDRQTANKAAALIARLSQPATSTSAASTTILLPPAPPGPTAAGNTVRIERKTESDNKPAATLKSREETSVPPAAAASPVDTTRVYSMSGTISQVSCADAPQIQITLTAATLTMHLHAADVQKLTVKASGTDSVAKGAFCTALRGKSARISYLLAAGKPWDGEIQEIEFRKIP